jgi:hypothetical protein
MRPVRSNSIEEPRQSWRGGIVVFTQTGHRGDLGRYRCDRGSMIPESEPRTVIFVQVPRNQLFASLKRQNGRARTGLAISKVLKIGKSRLRAPQAPPNRFSQIAAGIIETVDSAAPASPPPPRPRQSRRDSRRSPSSSSDSRDRLAGPARSPARRRMPA